MSLRKLFLLLFFKISLAVTHTQINVIYKNKNVHIKKNLFVIFGVVRIGLILV
jgi:hypothetical protein